MLSSKLNSALRLKNFAGCVGGNDCFLKQQRFLHAWTAYLSHVEKCDGATDVRDRPHINYNKRIRRAFHTLISDRTNTTSLFCARTFSTPRTLQDPDTFGNLSHGLVSEQVEMDEEEKAEEEFGQNEASVPKWQKLSPGQYARKIKSHIANGELQEALDVLDLMKTNRDKPTTYLYNLLIYGFAHQGNLKRCFKLYSAMRKRALEPNAATYTSLFNACATTSDKKAALEKLDELRRKLHEKSFELNSTHYNVMIKAYGYHGEMLKAFEIADTMIDRYLKLTDITYSCLFHAAINDKENGLRHCLVIWHMMKKHKAKPNIIHYECILRAIKDTKLGDLKVDDILVSNSKQSQVYLSKTAKPDLLASPPVLSTLLIALIEQTETKKLKDVKSDKNASQVATLPPSSSNELMTESFGAEKISQNLNQILENNRLILFGGVENLLQRMKADGAYPTSKTLTLLLDVIPQTLDAEQFVIDYARKNNIKLDIVFFNMLIRRRNVRRDYEAAKKVLNLMQEARLVPNVMTYGTLAIGCQKRRDAIELITEMENINYIPNAVLMDIFVRNAVYTKNVPYAIDMMKYMSALRMKPKEDTIAVLDSLSKTMLSEIQIMRKRNRRAAKRLTEEHKQFMERYELWKERCTRGTPVVKKTAGSTR